MRFFVFTYYHMNTSDFNSHNKNEFPPAHTTEHIINQTMIRMFGCGRAIEAHIERKKSKMDFSLAAEPTAEQVEALEQEVNRVIGLNLPVEFEYSTQEEQKDLYDLNRLPENASERIRIVRIGDYDACPCIGAHVGNTSEIGTFKVISSSFCDGVWRLRWKVAQN